MKTAEEVLRSYSKNYELGRQYGRDASIEHGSLAIKAMKEYALECIKEDRKESTKCSCYDTPNLELPLPELK